MQWLRAPSLRSISTLVILTIILNVTVLLLVIPIKARAASSWNPGLLVNTEAFQTIDDTDTTANVQLKFGEGLQESLTYNRSASQFEFTRSLKVGGNLTATGSLTITGTGSMSDLTIPSMALGTPTYSTVKDFMNSFGSTGRKSGGVISDAGSSTVAVTGGTGFIKATDDDNAQLLFFDFPAPANISIPSNSTRYIGVEYNGGSPQVVARTTWNWNLDSEFPLGRVVNDSINGADELYISNSPWWVTDGTTNIIEAIRSFGLVRRDQAVGGLMLSVTGTRNIAVSAGTVWSGLNEFDVSALDTAVSGTVEYYWYKAGSGWQASDVTQYSVTQWNDVTQTALQTMDNNKYGNIWVYGEMDSGVAEIALLYPQAQYNSAAEAEATNTPSNIPAHITEAGMLLGRIIIKQNVNTPVSVESAFGTTYTASVTSDHGNLSGLTDDDHAQYLLLTGRSGDQRIDDSIEVTGTSSGRILSFGTRLTGSGSVSIRTLTNSTTAFQVFSLAGTDPVFNVDTVNNRVGIRTAGPENPLEVVGTISGSVVHAEQGLTSSGNVIVAPGKTLRINGVTYTFPVGDGTASGKVLKTNAAGHLSWSTDNDVSGVSAVTTEGMFVNQGGDTMTGALQIRPGTLGQAELEVAGTASGRILSFGTRLTGSGSVTIRTLTDSITAFQVLDSDGGNPVFNIDTTNERVGIGTATPETALEVTGTMSGSQLALNGASLDSTKIVGVDNIVKTTTTKYNIYNYAKASGLTAVSPVSVGMKNDVVGEGGNGGHGTAYGVQNVLKTTTGNLPGDKGIAYGTHVVDDGTSTDGTQYGAYFDLDNANTTNYSIYVEPGSGNSYFGSSVGIGTPSPSTALEVAGTASGDLLHAQKDLSSSGTLAIEGAAAFGSTIKLGGVTYTFPVGDGTASGKVLKTNAAGHLSWSTDNDVSGVSAVTTEGMFVNQGGDTMTGALQIRPGTLGQAELEVAGTASGRILSFGTRLTGSGSVTIRTLTDSITAFQVFDSDGGNPVFNIDTTNERVGIGTAAPTTKLEVVGTISGSQLRMGNATTSGSIIYSSGSTLMATAKGASGQVLVSKGTGTPLWQAPTSAMVWYIDGTLAIGTSRGATVVLPFGFTCTDVDLRVDTAPAGAALIVDINKDSGTIFSTRPQISDGQTSEAGTHAFSTTDLPTGSVITLDIDQVGSGTAGSDLTVILKGTRKY